LRPGGIRMSVWNVPVLGRFRTSSFLRYVSGGTGPERGVAGKSRGARWGSALLVLLAVCTLMPTAGAQTWQRVDGGARDVGVGADGSVWVIGTAQVPGGFEIYRRSGSSWTKVPGGAERIAVAPNGNAWVVNSSRNIFRFDGTRFVQTTGAAHDVGVGGDGTVWVIGTDVQDGGHGIWRSSDNGANWTRVPGGAVRISVDPSGSAWVVNSGGSIFRYDGNRWLQLPGRAKDIGIGADGAAWIIGTDDGILRWDGSNWVRKTGGAVQVAAGRNGVVWVVNSAGQIYWTQDAPEVQVRQIFPRGERYEAEILRALGFSRFRHEVFLGGLPVASQLSPLEQGFARLGMSAAEAFFVSNPEITAEQAIARIRSDLETRRTVNTFVGLLLMESLRRKGGGDAQTLALRQWGTDLYRSIRIQAAKSALDQYKLWEMDPCGYDNLPASRCQGTAALFSAPRPNEATLGKNAMGSVMSSYADEAAAAAALGLTAAATTAAFVALTSSLGVTVVAPAAGATFGGVSTSLFAAFGGNLAGTTGAIGAAGWAGVVAAPVAAAVLAVVVGTIEGFAVVEAGRVEPMLKLKLGAAMNENIVIENALVEETGRDFFFLAFQRAAADGYQIPASTVDGEVRFYCQAGYVSRFKLTYTLDGRQHSHTTRDLPVGHEESFSIPARATNIVASGEWFDGINWKPLFTRNLPRPTFIGFTSYGTIFSPQVKDEYPEISNIIAQPKELTLTHGGGYVAHMKVTYQQGGRTVTAVDDKGTTLGWRRVFTIPDDATNVRLEAWSSTGLVWEPWKRIVDRSYPSPPNECIKVFGTTLDPKWNNECR
jgi:hypothetical protein